VRDESDHLANPGLGAPKPQGDEQAFRKPPPLHGRESHIRIFEGEPDPNAKLYGKTQISADGALPREEHGPSAVLKALDPFWTRGIIPGTSNGPEKPADSQV